jgi:hypothetical protein
MKMEAASGKIIGNTLISSPEEVSRSKVVFCNKDEIIRTNLQRCTLLHLLTSPGCEELTN